MTIAEAIARARHDVAKYVAMTSQNLGAPPWPERLREAVAKDVLETDGRRPVWEVWADRRPDLAALGDALHAVDRHVEAIRAREPQLRAAGAPGVDEALVSEIRSLARAVLDLKAA